MADIVVGRALRNDLVRQIAVRVCQDSGAEDLLRAANRKLVHHRAQTPVDNAAIFRARKTVGADIDSRQHSAVFECLTIARRREDSASLQDRALGTRSGESRMSGIRLRPPERTKKGVFQIIKVK